MHMHYVNGERQRQNCFHYFILNFITIVIEQLSHEVLFWNLQASIYIQRVFVHLVSYPSCM
jgi:hypothetical protein